MAMMALGGVAAALLVLWIPVGLVEMAVASSGLSEAVPAAAPPLGIKARLLMAGFAGLMAVGLIGVMRRDGTKATIQDDGKGRAQRVQGAKTMGFAFSKLTALARGRAMPVDGPDVPVLRRADAHPDAPSRAPIFASRDFDGIDIFARPEGGRRPLVVNREPTPDRAPVAVPENLVMPNAPVVTVAAPTIQPAFLRPAAPFVEPAPIEPAAFAAPAPIDAAPEEAPVIEAPAPLAWHREPAMLRPAPLPLPVEPTHGLSVAELTARLERGLAQRSRAMVPPMGSGGVIADMPVAAAVPVRASVEQDADDALRAALGALRSMAGRR